MFSISLPLILTLWWSLNAAPHPQPPLHTALSPPEGDSFIPPSLGPLRSLATFYLNFTSCPFSVYYFLTSYSPSQGPRAVNGQSCGIFFIYIVLGIHITSSPGPSSSYSPLSSPFFPLPPPTPFPPTSHPPLCTASRVVALC